MNQNYDKIWETYQLSVTRFIQKKQQLALRNERQQRSRAWRVLSN